MSKRRESLQEAYQAAKDQGDWKEAGLILISMTEAYPCICTEEALHANQGLCNCGRYAYLSRPVTPEELMLSGC